MNGITNLKNGQSISDLWDYFKKPNIRTESPEKSRKQKEKEEQ